MAQSSSDLTVLEQGNIYFVYRPKVEQTSVSGLEDVQQFNMILSPHGKSVCRLVTLDKKQLPSLATNGDYSGQLKFGIKALGDFTKEIQNVKPGTKAYLDGPYGVFTSDRYPDAALPGGLALPRSSASSLPLPNETTLALICSSIPAAPGTRLPIESR